MVVNRILNNGIRMAMEKIPSVQSVSIGIWVKTGSVNENPCNYGISHLIEHMLFKGTEKRSAKKIAEDVDRIGGHMNAFTSKECTCYYIKILGSNIEQASDIIIDMFMNSKFMPEELKKEKDVIYEEIKMTEDSPEDDVHDLLSEMVFRGSALESPIIGTYDSLESITREKILQYIMEEYTSTSIVISVAGCFDEDYIYDLFNGKFNNLMINKKEKLYEIPLYIPEYKVKVKEVEQSHICLGTKGLTREDDLYFPMQLLNSIIGGSMSSRLFQQIREERGLAYSVYSISQSYISDGIYSIYAGVSHEKVEETIKAIIDEMRLLANQGITNDELQTAKEQLKSSYVFSQENVNSRMFSIGKNSLLLSRLYTVEEIIEKINKVSMEDMLNAYECIADIKRYSVALISNRDYNLKNIIQES